MEDKILILGFYIFTLQAQISIADDAKCADIGKNLDKVDVWLKRIEITSKNFEELTSAAVSAVSNLNGEISRYTSIITASSCEDKDKKSQVGALLSHINNFKNNISKIVDDYTEKLDDINSEYDEACSSPHATTTKDLADAAFDLLRSIKDSSAAQDAALQKLTDKIPEETIANTHKLSRDIFSCVLDYEFKNIKSDITKFIDSLTKPLDAVESLKLKLNGTLTEEVEKFEYATRKLKRYDAFHGEHNFSECILNENVAQRVTEAGENTYKSLSGIAKNLTDYVNDGLKKKDEELRTSIGKCNDIKCIDALLNDTQALKTTVDDNIKNYKVKNVPSIAEAKMQEALDQFDKEVDDSLDCYMKFINSGSLGSAILYKRSFILLGLLIVSKFVLCLILYI